MQPSSSFSKPTELRLAPRAVHRMADAAGVTITCREGSVWITVDNDPRDIVLEAGGSFTASDHARALIYALEPSTVSTLAR